MPINGIGTKPAFALARADRSWLARLVTRREPTRGFHACFGAYRRRWSSSSQRCNVRERLDRRTIRAHRVDPAIDTLSSDRIPSGLLEPVNGSRASQETIIIRLSPSWDQDRTPALPLPFRSLFFPS